MHIIYYNVRCIRTVQHVPTKKIDNSLRMCLSLQYKDKTLVRFFLRFLHVAEEPIFLHFKHIHVCRYVAEESKYISDETWPAVVEMLRCTRKRWSVIVSDFMKNLCFVVCTYYFLTIIFT